VRPENVITPALVNRPVLLFAAIDLLLRAVLVTLRRSTEPNIRPTGCALYSSASSVCKQRRSTVNPREVAVLRFTIAKRPTASRRPAGLPQMCPRLATLPRGHSRRHIRDSTGTRWSSLCRDGLMAGHVASNVERIDFARSASSRSSSRSSLISRTAAPRLRTATISA